MFQHLTQVLSQTIKNISNKGRITHQDIKQTLRKIRIALLESDVSLIVIKKLINKIKKKCIGNIINNSLTPGQEFIKIFKNELIKIIGKNYKPLNISKSSLSIFLILGLQGSGKTTTTAKLAKFILENNKKKKILLTSIDTFRPAAIKQLEILSTKISIDFFKLKHINNPKKILKSSIKYAKIHSYDLLIIDTSGRLHINKKLMKEISEIYKISKPDETLLILDSLIGQDSINIIKKFNQTIPISGSILTKVDGNSRMGIALSLTYLTNIPIKFVGNGEKLENIEKFKSQRIVSKILGMGDVLSIIESIEKKVDKKYLKKLNTKIKKTNNFDLNDFLNQINQIKKIGGIKNFISKLPLLSNITQNKMYNLSEKHLKQMKSIIFSMTENERKYPNIIKGSRKKRIALGSGNTIQNVNKLLKQFKEIKNLMKRTKKIGILGLFNKIKNLIPK
ncbi:signal recognition particle protein [Buchnera aphidicola]|uniref:signal recognition particle protein n=1 Tax=Buchnera aphidicola TaxID=9 RepID=UPI0030ED3A4A